MKRQKEILKVNVILGATISLKEENNMNNNNSLKCKKRLIYSPNYITLLNYNPENVMIAQNKESNLRERGPPLKSEKSFIIGFFTFTIE